MSGNKLHYNIQKQFFKSCNFFEKVKILLQNLKI